jgi:hypothetical protein
LEKYEMNVPAANVAHPLICNEIVGVRVVPAAARTQNVFNPAKGMVTGRVGTLNAADVDAVSISAEN